jgi:hypothetical protein
VNLRANSNVILATGCNEWERGIDIVVEGRAVQIDDKEPLKRLAAAWRKKWDGRWRYGVGDGVFKHEDGETAIVFSVTPTKMFAFAKGTFGQTRYRF